MPFSCTANYASFRSPLEIISLAYANTVLAFSVLVSVMASFLYKISFKGDQEEDARGSPNDAPKWSSKAVVASA